MNGLILQNQTISLLIVFGQSSCKSSRVVGHNVALAEVHLEVIETYDCMLFSVFFFGFVCFVHLWFHYIASTLISLTEVGQRSFPTVRFHSAK